ncbi:hypothetical protein B566_EDAN008636 [Ephemera danica]|nr:hypothetical protein B566_EDAN008636 [Ephemera danica]
MPRGSGYVRYKLLSRDAFIKKCRGIVEIRNRGNECLAYALFVGMRLIFNPKLKQDIQDEDFVMQRGAQDLCERAGVDLSQGGGYEELEQFQAVMPPNVQIVVHTDLDGRSIYYRGEVDDVRHRLHLLLTNNHYDVIRSTVGAFACNYYCEECNTPHSRRDKHKCKEACSYCLKMPPCDKNIDSITCGKCHREFYNQQCYANHSTNKLNKNETVCDIYKKCPKCYRTYKKYPGRPVHTCGEFFCKICKKHCPRDHKCYMQKDRLTKPPSDKDVLYVYWDSECTQDTPVSDDESDGFYHKVNLICAQTVCHSCNSSELDEKCVSCGDRQHVFIDDPLLEFMEFLCITRNQFKKLICIAHNSSGYDSHFILKHVLTVLTVKPKIVMRGAKILCLEVNKLKFIDSLHYFPMALKQLPATFDMPSDVNKGYFPHFFNTVQNQNYVGYIPDARYYGAEDMTAKDHDKFMEWHAQRVQEDYLFNFREELVKYCKQDVHILTLACRKFKDMMIEVGNVNPFKECITLASCASLIFRRNFLKNNVVGIIPANGYRFADNQSQIAIKWLLSEERRSNIVIRHAGREKEVRLPAGQLVDGYYEAPDGRKVVYAFQGCYYHACRSCFNLSNTKLNVDKHDTLAMRRERTDRIIKSIKNQGYEVIEKWECEFQRELKLDPELNEYLSNHPMSSQSPLDPRDAYFGGRTESFRLYHEAFDNGEEMDYVDFVSLYPAILMYYPSPIGHCKIHLGPQFPDLTKIHGMVKCDILPPRNLYIPLLPARFHDKLLFVLCRSCAEELNQEDCNHEDENERVLSGTWVISEVKKALELGYRIVKIHEVWEYDVSVYNKETGTGGLFVEYIKLFLKIKQESSGFPEGCVTEQDRLNYIYEYFDKQGILLDQNKIEKNPGLRFVAKILLNSLYGRFAMNVARNNTEVIKDPQALYKLLSNPNLSVKTLKPIGQESIIANYEITTEMLTPDPTTNVAIAAFITAGARLELYKCLEILQERSLYVDTDSVIMTSRPGDERLQTGTGLGELTDELLEYGEDCKIREFIGAGAKHYGFKVYDRYGELVKTVMKVRGITLNVKNSVIVNFDTMRDMTLNNAEPVYVKNDHQIVKTKYHDILSKPQTKIYRVVFNKRRIERDSYKTLPYGFKRE